MMLACCCCCVWVSAIIGKGAREGGDAVGMSLSYWCQCQGEGESEWASKQWCWHIVAIIRKRLRKEGPRDGIGVLLAMVRMACHPFAIHCCSCVVVTKCDIIVTCSNTTKKMKNTHTHLKKTGQEQESDPIIMLFQ